MNDSMTHTKRPGTMSFSISAVIRKNHWQLIPPGNEQMRRMLLKPTLFTGTILAECGIYSAKMVLKIRKED